MIKCATCGEPIIRPQIPWNYNYEYYHTYCTPKNKKMPRYNTPRGYTHGKHWTDQDKATLNKHYPDWTISITEIAEKLGRTNASVRSMARHLGIRRNQT